MTETATARPLGPGRKKIDHVRIGCELKLLNLITKTTPIHQHQRVLKNLQ